MRIYYLTSQKCYAVVFSHLLSFSLPTCLLRVHVIEVILCVLAFYVNSKCKLHYHITF